MDFVHQFDCKGNDSHPPMSPTTEQVSSELEQVSSELGPHSDPPTAEGRISDAKLSPMSELIERCADKCIEARKKLDRPGALRAMIDAMDKTPNTMFGKGAAARTRKLLLVAIAMNANPDGTNAYPSYKTLARRALMSEKTVGRTLKWLQENSMIDIASKQGIAGSVRGATNLYTINLAYLCWQVDRDPRGLWKSVKIRSLSERYRGAFCHLLYLPEDCECSAEALWKDYFRYIGNYFPTPNEVEEMLCQAETAGMIRRFRFGSKVRLEVVAI